jgi:hypothetical protein
MPVMCVILVKRRGLIRCVGPSQCVHILRQLVQALARSALEQLLQQRHNAGFVHVPAAL